MDDREILAQFVVDGSQEAFAELVRRNVDAVYSSARRQLGDEHLAEDVTQAVFALLARKAGKIRGTAISWLITTTYFACRNATKLAVRRQFHERRAGEMRMENSASPEAEWESYAPILDEAMMRLTDVERGAVALRYLRGMSMKEVGAALGVSEEAARKRVDRAVDRLRGIMSAKTVVPAAGALASELAVRATQAAPAKLGLSIISSAGAIGQGTLGSAVAAKTAQTLALIKLKIAAMVILAITLAGAGTGAVIRVMDQTPIAPAPVAVATAPTVAMAQTEPAEASVPGEMQMARWDLLVDDSTANAVRAMASPIKTPSKIYQAYIGRAADIRAWVAAEIRNGGVLRNDSKLAVAISNAQTGNVQKGELQFGFGGWSMYYGFDPKQRAALDCDWENPNPFAPGQIVIAGDDKLQLNFAFDPLRLNVSEYFRNQLRTIATKPASMHYQGPLMAGEALAMIARFVGPSGKAFDHLVVWEAFKAETAQMPIVQDQTDCQWWVINGPERMQHYADVARAWAAQTDGPSALAEPQAISRKLSDGKTLWLDGLARPASWPGCWWDAKGNPSPQLGWVAFQGDPPGGLWFHLQLIATGREDVLLHPDDDGVAARTNPATIYNYSEVHQEGDQTTNLTVGVPVGPWEQIAKIKMDETVTAEGVNFHLQPDPYDKDPHWLNAQLVRTGALNDLYDLIAADTTGTEVHPGTPPSGAEDWAKYGRETTPRKDQTTFSFLQLRQSQVLYFRLMRRKREFVTFDQFAVQPTTAPALDVTAEQADAAEARQLQRQVEAQRKAWAAIPRDPKTPAGVMAMLADALARQDERAARGLMKASDPQAKKMLDQGVHLIILIAWARDQAVRRFGDDAVKKQLGDQALLTDVETGMLSSAQINWTPTADGKGYQQGWGGMMMRRNADGTLYLDMDGLMATMGRGKMLAMQIYLQLMSGKAVALNKLLAGNKPVSIEEVKAFLANVPKGPMGN